MCTCCRRIQNTSFFIFPAKSSKSTVLVENLSVSSCVLPLLTTLDSLPLNHHPNQLFWKRKNKMFVTGAQPAPQQKHEILHFKDQANITFDIFNFLLLDHQIKDCAKKRCLGSDKIKDQKLFPFHINSLRTIKSWTKKRAYISPEDGQSKDAGGYPNKSNGTPACATKSVQI